MVPARACIIALHELIAHENEIGFSERQFFGRAFNRTTLRRLFDHDRDTFSVGLELGPINTRKSTQW